MMRRTRSSTSGRKRKGFALLTVLLVAAVGAVIALGSAMLSMSSVLIQNASDRAAMLDDAALSGLEMARSRLNAKLDSVPVEGYRLIESGVTVSGGGNITRSTWVARIGNADSLTSTGEYGVQAEIVSQATDASGNVAIRRVEIYQESFARYASFTNFAKSTNGATLWWALGAQAQGPVHSNDTIYVWSGFPRPQATFHDQVTTAKIVKNKAAAEFRRGPPQEHTARIELPGTADLNILKNIAAKAGYVFAPDVVVGDSALVSMRIEFVAIDADGDGNTTGPQDGYFRVYKMRANSLYDDGYAMARTPPTPPASSGDPIPNGATRPMDSMYYSWNCGEVVTILGRPRVPVPLAAIPFGLVGNYTSKVGLKRAAFDDASTRCFLGGDERLSPTGLFLPVDAAGYWMPRTSGSVPPAVAARPDGAYLWPLSPSLNPSFRGVIFAEGRVGVSGVVRGRVTVASRDNLLILHDLRQATSPATTSVTCSPDDDVIGLFSGEYVLYSNNTLATPQQRRDNTNNGANWRWPRKDFDPSPSRPDLNVHASLLALKSVAAENPNPPGGTPGNRFVTRGTLRLIGGAIENRIGQTGTMSGSNLHGYYDDLSYNRCLLQYPPPYFPTTGHWSRSQYFEVSPENFSADNWFARR